MADADTRAIERYQANLHDERESMALYQVLASAERDPHLATIYTKMAAVEGRHAAVWEDHLREAGAAVVPYTPSWRVRTLGWLAKRLGPSAVLPIVNSMERDAVHAYDGQPEAQAMGMPHDDPHAISSGLQEALERQAQRWDRASRRVSDALQHLYLHRFGTVPLNVPFVPSGSSLAGRGGTMPTTPASSPMSEQRRT